MATLAAPNVSHFVDYQAFKDGMSWAVPPNGTLRLVSTALLSYHLFSLMPLWLFVQLFKDRAREFIAALCSQRLTDPSWVPSRLKFTSNIDREMVAETAAFSTEGMKLAYKLTDESDFEMRVRHYFSQVGHPDTEDIRLMVGPDRYDAESNDPLLRSRLFLEYMTASDLLPMDPQFNLEVCSSLVAFVPLLNCSP